jgi:predicted RNase H-like nuclease
MRTGRDLEALRRRLVDAKAECERRHAGGPHDAYLQAYVAVKALELQLDEQLRQPSR